MMNHFSRVTATVLLFLIVTLTGVAREMSAPFALEVLPAEHQKQIDAETGAELIFLTTDPASDTNLYFHEQSWLADESMIFFNSSRDGGGTMAYIVETGELVRLTGPDGGISAITAARKRNSILGRRGDCILEWKIDLEVSADPLSTPSKVTATEQVIVQLAGMTMQTPPTESCDSQLLAMGVAVEEGHAIYTVNVASGEYREVYRLPEPPRAGFHLQWSHVNPSMLSFVGNVYRLMVLDIREGTAKAIYKEQTDENVTHEHWWVADAHGDDQMVFCGGTHPEPVEDAHVKVVNVQTGVVRVIGAGSWWPEGQDEEVAKRNFWHCSGDKLGHWVVADNWHGDITIFEGATTRPHLLTTGHRVYGRGVHPHVGWDRQSKRVIFTSHRLGNPNVCIATIPEAWQPKSR